LARIDKIENRSLFYTIVPHPQPKPDPRLPDNLVGW